MLPSDCDNPFRPHGSISEDAETIMQLWKENRLEKWGKMTIVQKDNNNVFDANGLKTIQNSEDQIKQNENKVQPKKVKTSNCCFII